MTKQDAQMLAIFAAALKASLAGCIEAYRSFRPRAKQRRG